MPSSREGPPGSRTDLSGGVSTGRPTEHHPPAARDGCNRAVPAAERGLRRAETPGGRKSVGLVWRDGAQVGQPRTTGYTHCCLHSAASLFPHCISITACRSPHVDRQVSITACRSPALEASSRARTSRIHNMHQNICITCITEYASEYMNHMHHIICIRIYQSHA